MYYFNEMWSQSPPCRSGTIEQVLRPQEKRKRNKIRIIKTSEEKKRERRMNKPKK